MLLLLVSPVFWLVTLTWSPPKSLAWQKGFRLGSGLILGKPGLWRLVFSRVLLVNAVGMRLVVIEGTLWLGVPFLLLLFCLARFSRIGGLLLI